MRSLLRFGPSPAKGKACDEAKKEWKPRSALDVSGHSFRKELQTELRRAKQAQREYDDSLREDNPYLASENHQHLAGLRSPKRVLRSLSKESDAPTAWWECDKVSGKALSRTASESTQPASPPSLRSSLPPRIPKAALAVRA